MSFPKAKRTSINEDCYVRVGSLGFLQEMDDCSADCYEEHEYLQVKVLNMSAVSNCLTTSALIEVKFVGEVIKIFFLTYFDKK